jgi:hypothetical protein
MNFLRFIVNDKYKINNTGINNEKKVSQIFIEY